jgi:hypothetical protein
MATKINGSVIEFAGYEYGRLIAGEIMQTGFYDRPEDAEDELFFRAVYRTDWIKAKTS